LEEKARIARYEFFDEVLKKYGSDKIILAHHLDDKIETFFFNLVR
jgi:tRNA(Ile)-lysidine synthase TilS/MesJ